MRFANLDWKPCEAKNENRHRQANRHSREARTNETVRTKKRSDLYSAKRSFQRVVTIGGIK